MGEIQANTMDVPKNWTEIKNPPFSDPDALAYSHDERGLRGQVRKSGSKVESSIVEESGDYVVAPETFDDREDAIERLRMHMEYYS